jgi:WD40 repeat protein
VALEREGWGICQEQDLRKIAIRKLFLNHSSTSQIYILSLYPSVYPSIPLSIPPSTPPSVRSPVPLPLQKRQHSWLKCAWSPDARMVVGACSTMCTWDVANISVDNRKCPLLKHFEGHYNEVMACAFSPGKENSGPHKGLGFMLYSYVLTENPRNFSIPSPILTTPVCRWLDFAERRQGLFVDPVGRPRRVDAAPLPLLLPLSHAVFHVTTRRASRAVHDR